MRWFFCWKELCHLDIIAFYPPPLGNFNDKPAVSNRQGHQVVALVGRGAGSSCRVGTGNRDCITAGFPVTSSRYCNSANADAGPTYTDTGSANAADAGPIHASAPNAGDRTNCGGALPAYPDRDTTYSACTNVSYCADDVSDAGNITSLDSHATTSTPNAATGLWS